MGVTKTCTTFRLSEETLSELHSIQKALAPFAEDRSSTLRIVIKLMYALLFTPMTIKDLVEVLQRLQGNTLSYAQMQFRFPSAISMTPKFGRGVQ